jgi:hypothetical protein
MGRRARLTQHVTPLARGERFHDKKFVRRAAKRLIAARGGH